MPTLAAVGLLSAAAIDPAPHAGMRLLDFGPSGGRRWVAESEVAALAHRAECKPHRRHRPGDVNNESFIDVTDHLDADAVRARTAKLRARIPTSLRHEEFVRDAINLLDVNQYRSDIEHLSSYHNRYYTQQDAADAVHWLADQYRAAVPARRRRDVTVQVYAHSWAQPSLIVTVAGSGPDAAETVVLGGHIDSIAGGATSLAPGADDDASGSAALLQAFRVLMSGDFSPSRSVEFQAYAAEEVGLRGSQAIAQEMAGNNRVIAGMLQLDMTGWDNGNPRVGVITDYTDASLNEFIRTLTRGYLTIPPADGRCGYGCSDHASFDRYGYPASFAFEAPFGEHNPNIHTARDTLANMNMTHAAEFAKLAVGFAVEMACSAAKAGCGGHRKVPAAEQAWTAEGLVRLGDGRIDLANIGGFVANRSRVPPLGVVGGTEVRSAADYPWMTGWIEQGQQYCGGSLISDQWVLTAAHCYIGITPSSSMGSVRFTAGGGAEIVDGAQFHRHPSYNANSLDYDAAVIRLAATIRESNNIKPIRVAAPSDGAFDADMATVTGWGATSSGGSATSVLREVTYPVITNSYCSQMYSGITARMLCAYQEGGGRDACQGDSGGPLAVERAGEWIHVGIVSWGQGCAGNRAPGVYGRTSEFHSWICSTCNCC